MTLFKKILVAPAIALLDRLATSSDSFAKWAADLAETPSAVARRGGQLEVEAGATMREVERSVAAAGSLMSQAGGLVSTVAAFRLPAQREEASA